MKNQYVHTNNSKEKLFELINKDDIKFSENTSNNDIDPELFDILKNYVDILAYDLKTDFNDYNSLKEIWDIFRKDFPQLAPVEVARLLNAVDPNFIDGINTNSSNLNDEGTIVDGGSKKTAPKHNHNMTPTEKHSQNERNDSKKSNSILKLSHTALKQKANLFIYAIKKFYISFVLCVLLSYLVASLYPKLNYSFDVHNDKYRNVSQTIYDEVLKSTDRIRELFIVEEFNYSLFLILIILTMFLLTIIITTLSLKSNSQIG